MMAFLSWATLLNVARQMRICAIAIFNGVGPVPKFGGAPSQQLSGVHRPQC
jgi:hypothetical protein